MSAEKGHACSRTFMGKAVLFVRAQFTCSPVTASMTQHFPRFRTMYSTVQSLVAHVQNAASEPPSGEKLAFRGVRMLAALHSYS